MGKHAKNNIIFNLRFRKYLYNIAEKVMPLLIAYGIVDRQTAILWLSAVFSILVGFTARTNTPKQQEERE